MSSISSTLATVAGGMLPLLLKNIHTAKFGMINLKAVKLLRGHIESIINSYEHKWPIVDIKIDNDYKELQNAANVDIEVSIPKKEENATNNINQLEDGGGMVGQMNIHLLSSELNSSNTSVDEDKTDTVL